MDTISCEAYTDTIFKEWTDGPKVVLDTVCFGGLEEYKDTIVTIVIENDDALKMVLNNVAFESVATFYFIDDARSAELARILRPDLNIRLLVT